MSPAPVPRSHARGNTAEGRIGTGNPYAKGRARR